MRLVLFWRCFSAVLLFAITAASLLPAIDTLSPYDKLVHASAYASLSLALLGAGMPRLPWLVLAVMAWSMAIEWAQTAVPGRSGDWMDVVANAAGLIIALLLAPLFLKFNRLIAEELC